MKTITYQVTCPHCGTTKPLAIVVKNRAPRKLAALNLFCTTCKRDRFMDPIRKDEPQ